MGTPEEKPKIIVAGLPRTATTSIKAALEELGYGPGYHLIDISTWINCAKPSAKILQTSDKHQRQRMLKDLFDPYGSILDLPGSACLDDLLEMYPNAKVILTGRSDPGVWLDSFCGIQACKCLELYSIPYQVLTYWAPNMYATSTMLQAFLKMHSSRFGIKEEPDLELYHAYGDWVRLIVPAENLLEFNPAQGWKPLCDFLGKDVPQNRDFPKLNGRGYLRGVQILALLLGIVLWAALFGLSFYTGTFVRNALWLQFGYAFSPEVETMMTVSGSTYFVETHS